MTRLLIICLSVLLIYLGFVNISSLDAPLNFSLYGYLVETSLFVAIALISTIFCLCSLIIKLILTIFSVPSFLKRRLLIFKTKKANDVLVSAVISLIIGDKKEAIKLVKNLKTEYKILQKLTIAEAENDFDKQTEIYRSFLSEDGLKAFGYKRLAEVHFNRQYFTQANDYAKKAVDLNSKDRSITAILAKCAAIGKHWSQFNVNVIKLRNLSIDNDFQILKNNEIVDYYLAAAHSAISDNHDNEAITYLKQAIEIDPLNIEVLELYFVTAPRDGSNLNILESAFKAKPSLEVAELLIRYRPMPSLKAFEYLTHLVDYNQYSNLFIAIASYLDLPEQVHNFRSRQLISAL